jgi:alpha-galactosidase
LGLDLAQAVIATRRLLPMLAWVLLHGAYAAAEPRVAPKPAEIAAVREWTETAFAKPRLIPGTEEAKDGLVILRQSHKVLANRTAWDTPITLGDKQFAHGIYMDTPAALLVRLPQPASELTAQVGIDNNADTRAAPTVSSARFHVVVGGKRVFSTPVRKLRDGGLAIRVPLDGAREITLETDDGGDGRSHDQCVWAETAVKLADGSLRLLDGLPFAPRHANRSTAPFSFIFGGRTSDALLPGWEYAHKTEPLTDGSRQLVSYRDPKTGLLIEAHATRYADAPAIDWVCYLSNTGTADTPVIEDLMPLDAILLPGHEPRGPVTLRWSNGDGCTENSFLPHDEPLRQGSPREFAATSSDTTCLPFFNLKAAEAGWILAVGWTGRWKADFLHDPSGAVRVRAGMQATRFRLKPGERVRTPRIVLLRYGGARPIDGNNAFRRLMLSHYVPQEGGKPAIPPVATNTVAGLWLRSARTKKPLGLLSEAGELACIARAAAMGCEAYWMDAYWFPQPWYEGNIGNWYPRKDDFPRGLRPLGDAAHRHALKFVLWFAPLHINPGTQWARDYPQFVHGGGEGRGGVWKLGDPAARQWLAGWLSDRRRQWAFDVYREDFGTGMPPEEGDDRIGIAEMKHIEGFYWFWSELKRRNPGLLIDNCSGGGRRIDVETAPLAYCLWRSDFNDVGEGLKDQAHWPMMGRADQVMVTGLSLYYPLHTGPVWDMRPYSFRSAMSPGIVIYTDTESKEFSAESARQGIAELKTLRPLFLGDIYPLLPLTTSQADWYAYQLDRSDLRQGCVLVFRRPQSPDAAREVRLENVDPDATYSVSITGETYGHAEPKAMSGRDLARRKFQIDTRPGSVLLQYQKK